MRAQRLSGGVTAFRRRRQRGQAIVESSLVLIVVLATVVGICDFGQVVFVHQSLTNRARKAVRYGSINYTDLVAVRNIVLYNQTTVPGDGTQGYLGLTAAMVNVSRADQDTNDERIVVTISNYPFHFFSPWIAGAYTGRKITASSPVEAD